MSLVDALDLLSLLFVFFSQFFGFFLEFDPCAANLLSEPLDIGIMPFTEGVECGLCADDLFCLMFVHVFQLLDALF
jgi:hypothetical protein